MNMKKRPVRLGFAAALLALVLSPLVFGAQSALAQGPPATYYGGDQANHFAPNTIARVASQKPGMARAKTAMLRAR